MSLFLQRPLFGCATAALGLSGAAYGLIAHQRRTPLRLESSPNPLGSSSSTNPKDWSFSQYQNEARAPVVSSRGGLNAKAVRQMTLGSILGTSNMKHKHTCSQNNLQFDMLTSQPQVSPPVSRSPSSANPSPSSSACSSSACTRRKNSSESQSFLTTRCRNTSKASTFAAQCKIMLR